MAAICGVAPQHVRDKKDALGGERSGELDVRDEGYLGRIVFQARPVLKYVETIFQDLID